LRAERPDSPPLCIVGQAGWKETPLHERAQQLGLANQIVVSGFVLDEELAALYKSALALIFSSHYEGFGLPLVEALASGTPVIATRTSSVPEVLGSSGVMVPPADTEALAAAMQQLLDEPTKRARLRDGCLAQSSRFSWTEAARRTLAVYARSTSQTRMSPLTGAGQPSDPRANGAGKR
jgi:glycosyltransferase involved in cell wall biosynthesis